MASDVRDEPEPIRQQPPDPIDDDDDLEAASENTPLLPSETDENPDQSQPQRERSAEDLLRSITSGSNGSGKLKRRWPSLLALLLLSSVAVLIIVFAFIAPGVVERYAKEAISFEVRSLGFEDFTDGGVKARIQGAFWMDASRVKKKSIRDLGRFGTWIAREVESGESHVEVLLPEYGNVVLGTAEVPPVKVDVRNGHTTAVDFISVLEPGDKEGIRRIARDWVDGRLGQLRVVGRAKVPIKSGIFSFGKQTLSQEMLFANNDIPSIPDYDIQRLNFHDAEPGTEGMEADVSLKTHNDYPVDLVVPSLGFQILVEDCKSTDPYIKVANAITSSLHIHPKSDVELDVTGMVRKLPDLLTQDCPGSDKSPLDMFLGNYIRGKENKIYVRGASSSPSNAETPQWLTDLLSEILVPVPLPGGGDMDHLIRNFSLADTHFNLPSPLADPSTPESQPRISAKVKALINLPEEMNFNISTNRIRADAKVYYKGDEMGTLDLKKWQPANSTRVEGTDDDGPMLLVQSTVDKAPLNITDEQVFADVLQDLLFGDKTVVLHMQTDVDVEVETKLGEFKVRKIPAEGSVPVKPLSRGHPGGGDDSPASGLHPKINDLQITATTENSLTLSALVNLTNPTEYAATIPYIDIHIVKNDSILGHATARDLYIEPGQNDNLLVQAVYAPLSMGGSEAKAVGRELLSQYISGWNTILGLQTHNGTIPSHPALGEALARFLIEIPTPRLSVPKPPPSDPEDPGKRPPDDGDDGGDEDEGTHFIRDATMHLLSSTATFTLLSPLRHSTLYIEDLNATALYKGDDVGRILYDLPFAVPPVDKDGHGITSPKLPVDWSLGSAGFDAVRDALGGTLKLAANAWVGIRVGEFRERVWFQGRSIGARVRL